MECEWGCSMASWLCWLLKQVILLLRLYALYNCSRRFAYVAAGCAFGIQLIFLSGFAAFVVGGVLGSSMSSFTPPLDIIWLSGSSGRSRVGGNDILQSHEYERTQVLTGILGSLRIVSANKYLVRWRAIAYSCSFEVLVLILTMRKALQFRHSTLRLTNLVSTLVWDSIVYASL